MRWSWRSPLQWCCWRAVNASPNEVAGTILEQTYMTVDERIEALTMNLELAFQDIQELKALAQRDGENIQQLRVLAQRDGENIQQLKVLAHQDGENIRTLARIAEAHQRRIEDLENQQ